MRLYDNKYYYVKDLGSGGFGKVFLAKEELSNRFVAIKQLKKTNKKDQIAIIHEIEMIAKFDHQNIVTYFHHFWEKDQLFLVMEYCTGGSLRDWIGKGDMDITKVMSWMQTLTSCLRTVHKKGIIHHDIKPDNILFTKNGALKISDFGVANKNIGTRCYMSPESFSWEHETRQDPRIDIYALGVTFMELLIGTNPFNFLTINEILAKHQKADFPIQELPNWQQDIILKSINKIPELRFQFMVEFEEAIKAKSVHSLFKKETFKAAELVVIAERALKTNKWRRAARYFELAYLNYPNNVTVLHAFGKYYLRIQQIGKAKEFLERAVRLNPRLDVQKDLGWINLENKKYPLAMALLSDHLHRNPSDFEAYNLLIRCYYETNRYESAMELSKMLMETNGNLPCFANNYYISYVLHNNGKEVHPKTIVKTNENPFINYNYSVLSEKSLSHSFQKSPTLKSKLLFMDFQFNSMKENTITFLDSTAGALDLGSTTKPIIKFGRENYLDNDFQVPGGIGISRRHCLIINTQDNVWLYDLESTGTFLNNEKIIEKKPIIGFNKLTIGPIEYSLTTDKNKLL
jgi:serine/threonine protein kinase